VNNLRFEAAVTDNEKPIPIINDTSSRGCSSPKHSAKGLMSEAAVHVPLYVIFKELFNYSKMLKERGFGWDNQK